MTIRRVVPNITSDRFDASREFYADSLGFDVGMDRGWVITSLGIVYPLTDEPWRVRRFFVTDPNGVITFGIFPSVFDRDGPSRRRPVDRKAGRPTKDSAVTM
jgi:hypothetical protein